MLTVPRPFDATGASVAELRLATLGRRVAASPALANAISDLAFGAVRRDDVVALHAIGASRVTAAATGAPS